MGFSLLHHIGGHDRLFFFLMLRDMPRLLRRSSFPATWMRRSLMHAWQCVASP